MILKYIAGPVIGAVIGYCTNYLAVKMLFYPKKEIRICGHRMPFTPGAIPKGKPRLAKAIGEIVGKSLLTKDDLAKQLLTEETEEKIVNRVIEFLNKDIKQELLFLTGMDEEGYHHTKEKLSSVLCDELARSVSEMKIGDIIVQEGSNILREKVKGTMLEMFLSDEAIKSIAGPIGDGIQNFIDANGKTYLRPVLEQKIELLEETSASDLLAKMDCTQEVQKNFIKSVYRKAIQEGMDAFGEKFDIAGIIEEKINAMDINELEHMVLSVMKKELDTIVNLGAFIGLLLGIFNIFI